MKTIKPSLEGNKVTPGTYLQVTEQDRIDVNGRKTAIWIWQIGRPGRGVKLLVFRKSYSPDDTIILNEDVSNLPRKAIEVTVRLLATNFPRIYELPQHKKKW